MNESPIRRFCESPHRNLIVIIATTLFGVVVLVPPVDDYFDGKSRRNTLTEELESARRAAEDLPNVEKKVAGIKAELAMFESRAISRDSMSRYRTQVVEIVRKADCQVRRFDVSRPNQRPWMVQDNPLNLTVSQELKSKTPFTLERRNVVLLVDGTMESITQLLTQLYQEDSLAYLHRLELKASSRGGEQVSVEIEMWLFALGRQKA